MKLRELTLNEMAATGGGASPGGPSGPSGPPSSPPSATVPTLASTARVGARPPGSGHGLSQQGDLAVGKGGIFLGHQQAQEPHNYDADAQVGQGLEWPKAAGASETTDVKRDEVEMPGEHHVAHHGDTHDGHGVSESTLREFAPGGSEDGDADPYRYPKPESYSRSADFFGRFEADHFDHEDFDDATGVFKGYWDSTQIAYFKFDNPEKASGDSPGMGWYYEPDADITNDNTPAKPAVDTSAQRKQQELGMIDAFLKSGQTAKPGSQIHGLMKKHGMAEGLDEAVGGNYLYHATSADGLKGMLSSGSIRSATGPQAATSAQTRLPTVSVTRDWGYASGAQAQSQLGGIGRDAILVLDRNTVESNFKTLGTSQSTIVKGLSLNPYLSKDGKARSQNTDPMARANAKAKMKYAEPTTKAGGEFEEAVVVPKGALPLKGTMVGFWVNPKSELMKDPAIMNDPRRLDMIRPNQFVKATKQGVAEGSMNEFALPGGNDGDSGRWYTDDELADIIGDDWFEDFDVSHDEFNIDAYGEKAKQNLAGYANSWFDDKGYNVNVMGVDHNEVDHDLKWYIVGSFQNDNFADKDVAEGEDSNEIGPGWKTEHGIVDQVDGNSVIVKTSQGKMRVNINDIKTAEAPKEGVMEDGEATVSADIATVAYPMTRGRTRREKRRNARRAVGQSFTAGPPGVGTGVFEASLATMRDYFAGNDDAKDTTKLATMRDYFTSIDKNIPDTIQRILWKVKNNVSLQPLEYSQYKTWMQNRRNTKIAKEAHVLGHQNVIYRLDKDKPMTDTEVLVLGGAGRYTLGGLRDKARREADAMAADLKVEHGGSFRRASDNIKQLTNTLNTIVAAYNELKRIRSKGGRGSRGITDEESNFMRECTQRMNTLELYTHRVRQARRIVEGIHHYLAEDKMSHEQASVIKGMFHLKADPGYGFYRYAIHVAGNQGGDKVVLGPNAGPFAYAYTPEEEKMIRDAVKAITGTEPLELTGNKSKEPDFVNKNSTVPSIDWKKVK